MICYCGTPMQSIGMNQARQIWARTGADPDQLPEMIDVWYCGRCLFFRGRSAAPTTQIVMTTEIGE